MSNFKQYLEEGRDAPLYHGTDLLAAVFILKDNKLIAKNDSADPRNFDSISLSRSLKAATTFVFHGRDANTCVVFELDQRKLAQRYKIKPYNYYTNSKLINVNVARFKGDYDWSSIYQTYAKNEYEEYIPISVIKNISSYIKFIHIQSGLTLQNLYKFYGNSKLVKDKRLIIPRNVRNEL